MGSTNQADPSCIYVRISWILMERPWFNFLSPPLILRFWSSQCLRLLRPCNKPRGQKKIKSTLFHQYSWNSEVETTWISLIGWPHKTSRVYPLNPSWFGELLIFLIFEIHYSLCFFVFNRGSMPQWTPNKLLTVMSLAVLYQRSNYLLKPKCFTVRPWTSAAEVLF